MRFALSNYLVGFLIITSSTFTWAEESDGHIDMSSEMLLSSSPKNSEPPGIQSGRYKQKKPTQLPAKKVAPKQPSTDVDQMMTVTLIPGTTTSTVAPPPAKPAPKTELQKSLFEGDYKKQT